MTIEYETRTEEYYQKENRRRNAQRLYRAVLLSKMIGDLDPKGSAVVVFKSKGMDNQKNKIIVEKKLVISREHLLALRKTAFSAYDALSRPLRLNQESERREKVVDPKGKTLADLIIKNTRRIAESMKQPGRPYKEGEEREIKWSKIADRLSQLEVLIRERRTWGNFILEDVGTKEDGQPMSVYVDKIIPKVWEEAVESFDGDKSELVKIINKELIKKRL